jgi:hypothetical protein
LEPDVPTTVVGSGEAAPLKAVPEIRAGDVYQTYERIVAFVTAVKGEGAAVALVAYAPSVAQGLAFGWPKLNGNARRIAIGTCLHHIECGNWTFIENVEKKWVK